MKKIIVFIALALNSGGILAQDHSTDYSIRGSVSGIPKRVKMVMYTIDQSVLKVDSCFADDSGKFEFKGSVNIPVKATITYTDPQLNAIDVVGRSTPDQLILFLEPGEVKIKGNSLATSRISGGGGQADFSELLKRQSTSTEDSINFNFIRQHPKSFVSLWLLKSYTKRAEPKLLDSLWKRLDSSVVSTEAGAMVKSFVQTALATAIGKPALDFSITDIKDQQVTLSEFRGKIILIDFWASWCVPCRIENKDVLNVYHSYAPKGFEIIGVSIDSQLDKWKKAVKDDGLTWLQVCDMKQEIARMYGIRSLPQNILIDANGVIVGKNLRSLQLEAKLKEMYGVR